MAFAVVCSITIVAIFMFAQRWVISGLTAAGVKDWPVPTQRLFFGDNDDSSEVTTLGCAFATRTRWPSA